MNVYEAKSINQSSWTTYQHCLLLFVFPMSLSLATVYAPGPSSVDVALAGSGSDIMKVVNESFSEGRRESRHTCERGTRDPMVVLRRTGVVSRRLEGE